MAKKKAGALAGRQVMPVPKDSDKKSGQTPPKMKPKGKGKK